MMNIRNSTDSQGLSPLARGNLLCKSFFYKELLQISEFLKSLFWFVASGE